MKKDWSRIIINFLFYAVLIYYTVLFIDVIITIIKL